MNPALSDCFGKIPVVILNGDAAIECMKRANVFLEIMLVPEFDKTRAPDGQIVAKYVECLGMSVLYVRFLGFPDEKDNGFLCVISTDADCVKAARQALKSCATILRTVDAFTN